MEKTALKPKNKLVICRKISTFKRGHEIVWAKHNSFHAFTQIQKVLSGLMKVIICLYSILALKHVLEAKRQPRMNSSCLLRLRVLRDKEESKAGKRAESPMRIRALSHFVFL